MPRVTRGFKARRRRNKILKLAKGFRGGRHRLFRTATEAVDRALCYAYRDRRVKKREFRQLWITRINAAAQQNGTSYSRLIGAMTKNSIELDRKVLSNLAIVDPNAFTAVVRTAGQLH
ncbi:50S ribosomal protein L20 [Desulfobulbus oligotrophicus]|jgi:large subunit ribosomal protein L20|uniref:Large ribosomal subunit protein bL20 n=1 Tax=Desulfobulbus oligotrophicus TaxID=1909699 RepID=A0A7T5VEG7_9BACT|nr:50S ribosomal protein L20 [Desulfobulbus oligotrophicus]MDY0390644.1 50S ribosomal protein L20 [Desulfobulbus oligotrophicus]QQG66419.1 50S ribosomal protein L20 [Desulfobulbus oligotrophicus]